MNKSKHFLTTLGVAIVLVWAFTASSRAQKYSDSSAPINLGPTINSTSIDGDRQSPKMGSACTLSQSAGRFWRRRHLCLST